MKLVDCASQLGKEKAMGKKKGNPIRVLNKAYLSHQLAIFYGAGLSKPFDFPGWRELIEKTAKIFSDDGHTCSKSVEEKLNSNDFWGAITLLQKEYDAQSIKNEIAKMIQESEDDLFSSDVLWPDNNYEDLKKLDVSLFITTNFDRVLSKIMPEAETTDFLNHGQELKDRFGQSHKRIIYLHGTPADPTSIVISEDDVKKVYGDSFWESGLATVANISTILFIGVSFDDKYLRKFLKQRSNANNNRCYAMMLDESTAGDDLYTVINVGKKNTVERIREELAKISKKPIYMIWIKLEKVGKTSVIDYIKVEIKQNFDVFWDEIGMQNTNDDAPILSFLSCNANISPQKIRDTVKEAVKKAYASAGCLYKPFVCFVSRNEAYIRKENGTIKGSYKNNVKTLLTELIFPGSSGFIFDRIGLPPEKDEDWLQDFTDKRLQMKGPFELSLIVEDSVKIPEAKNSGVEVHVAGLLFDQGRLILEERTSREAISPAMFSLPGGRLKKGESFCEAINRILREKYKLSVGTCFNILDEFRVHDAAIPGIAFVGNIKSNKGTLHSYSLSEIRDKGKKVACDYALIEKAFYHINRITIKLRIIMLTDCVYNCRCCHHENIVEQYTKCDVDKVIKCLESVSRSFILKKITITGGEPLLPCNRGHLLRLLDYIRENLGNVDLSVITNAHYLDTDCIKQLKKYDVRYKISVYGYDTPSFLKYTGAEKCFVGDPSFDYIDSLLNKLHILNQQSCLVTLNIPFHKTIATGLQTLLEDSPFAEAIRDCHVKLKIIEMVAPRRGGEFFPEDFDRVTESAFVRSGATKPSVSASSGVEEERGDIFVYQYPCKLKDGCKNCINRFALTVKPNGDMLICKHALQGGKIEEASFTDMGIHVETVDFKKEYHF